MSDADRTAAEAFDRFLDTLTGATPNQASTAGADPDLANVARRFHALESTSLPPSTRERVWRGLITPAGTNGYRSTADAVTLERSAVPGDALIGTQRRVTPAPADRDRRWPVRGSGSRFRVPLAVAIAITLLLAWFAYGDHRPWGDEQFGARIAAPEVTPETSDVLLALTVDQSELPGELGFISIMRNTAQPGSWHTSLERGERGLFIYLVESGTLTVELTREGRVIRDAGGAASEEAAPVGAQFELAAGDALVFPAQVTSAGNTSGAPADYLVAIILDPIGPPGPNPDNVGEITGAVLDPAAEVYAWDLAPGPVELVLRRITMEPGEEIPAPNGGTQAAGQESGTPHRLVVRLNRTAINSAPEPIGILLLTLTPVHPPASPVAAVS